MPPALLAAAVAVFLGLFGVVLALSGPVFRSQGATRSHAVEKYVHPQPRDAQTASASSGIADGIVAFGDKVMSGRESTPRLMARLQRADLPVRAGEWWVLRLVAVVVGIAIGVLVLGERTEIAGALAGAALGLSLPPLALTFLVRRRSRRFERQLPEVLTLIASSLATGFSLLQSLDAVARDAGEPAAKEFGRAIAECRIGTDVEESLGRMARRMDSRSMEWTAMAIQIQRQVGGNLAETLRTTAATLREREMLRRHVAGLSAEGKLSAYILVGLPVGLFLFFLRTNYDYISLLWTTPVGWGMSGAGLVSLTIGVFWMSKVVVVEV
ncbi:MAG: type II secretion system F family protein [Actinomycetota bacterium]|nr:type II secretion system F family protein [Actinomycetota bacterium]